MAVAVDPVGPLNLAVVANRWFYLRSTDDGLRRREGMLKCEVFIAPMPPSKGSTRNPENLRDEIRTSRDSLMRHSFHGHAPLETVHPFLSDS